MLTLSACSADQSDDAATTTAQEVSTTTSVGTGPVDEEQERDLALAREVGRFTPSQVDERIYLLVDPGISNSDLVSAATAWHQREPDADLNFFDDDAEIPKILSLLSKTEAGDTTGFPSDWIVQHQIARLQRFVGASDGKPWKLGLGTSVDPNDTLADLP